MKWGNAAGLNLTSDDDFFSDATVKGYYKAHVKVVIAFIFEFWSKSFGASIIQLLDVLDTFSEQQTNNS